MIKEKTKYLMLCLISLLLVPTIASARDMIMPTVDIVEGMVSWCVILMGLAVEVIFVKIFLKEKFPKALLMAFVMNLVSGVLCLVALPLSGLVGELLLMAFPTYHISHWIYSFLVTIILYAVFEALTAKIIFKKTFKKMLFPLCLTNAITLGINFMFNPYWLEHIHFSF